MSFQSFSPVLKEELEKCRLEAYKHAQLTLPAPVPRSGQYVVFDSPISGKGLEAKQHFMRGDEILMVTNPLLSILNAERLDDTCACCCRSQSPGYFFGDHGDDPPPDEIRLRICGGCRIMKYCSEPCQREHWKAIHSLECRIYAREPRCKTLTTAVRAAMQLALMEDEVPNLVYTLESHMNDWELDPSRDMEWKNIIMLAGGAAHLVGAGHMQDEVIEYMCTIMTNSFTLVSPTYDSLGLLLDPLLSRINHSCDPNAYLVMHPSLGGPAVSVRTLREIRPGEEIFISYIDASQEYLTRREMLRKQYHFECKCSACAIQYSREFCQRELAQIGASARYLKQALVHKDLDSRPRLLALQNALRCSYHRNFGYRQFNEFLTIQPFPTIRQELFVSAIAGGVYGRAFVHGMILQKMIMSKIQQGPYTPLGVVHSFVLLRLMDYIANGPDEKWRRRTTETVSQENWTETDAHSALTLLKLSPTFRWDLEMLKAMKIVVESVYKTHGPFNVFTRVALAQAVFLIAEYYQQGHHRSWGAARGQVPGQAVEDMRNENGSSSGAPGEISLPENVVRLLDLLREVNARTQACIDDSEKTNLGPVVAHRARSGLKPLAVPHNMTLAQLNGTENMFVKAGRPEEKKSDQEGRDANEEIESDDSSSISSYEGPDVTGQIDFALLARLAAEDGKGEGGEDVARDPENQHRPDGVQPQPQPEPERQRLSGGDEAKAVEIRKFLTLMAVAKAGTAVDSRILNQLEVQQALAEVVERGLKECFDEIGKILWEEMEERDGGVVMMPNGEYNIGPNYELDELVEAYALEYAC